MNKFFEHFNSYSLLKVGLNIIICISIISILKRILITYFGQKISHQSRLIFNKIITFTGISVMLIVIINQLGFTSLFTTVLGTPA